jgi:hypothetical protein|tara:strand:- start:1106 stop:1411 length:306 start_codon:yes stop_codon:yes gene_type:complete
MKSKGTIKIVWVNHMEKRKTIAQMDWTDYSQRVVNRLLTHTDAKYDEDSDSNSITFYLDDWQLLQLHNTELIYGLHLYSKGGIKLDKAVLKRVRQVEMVGA